ncbi:hypothetical protein BDV93DRAFT_593766 [Ceratobasidium sp. AG-I]|nr:hypothetical protein BDV93DRAFT_593766 [Ceratobasidium sp. AG-I]
MGTGLSGRGRSRHLKGPAVSSLNKKSARYSQSEQYKKWKGKGKEVWNNNAALLSDIDKLPTGPIWKTAQVLAGRGLYERSHTLYFRDICEVIRELIGARRFKDCMRYAPEHHWTSRDQKCRVYDEAWSGDWWWRMQYLIHNRNGTVVPLIIARDETILANNLRGKKAHPVYLSIGNISKVTQRKPTKRAMILVGYVPVNRFKDVLDKKTRRYFRGDLLHRSLEVIFEPLKTASVDGMLARCADGYLRHIYPIISAWIADWPKQNDLAGTTQSGCPKCCHKWKGRGQGGPSVPLCDPGETLAAIQEYLQNWRPGVLKRHLVTPWVPFWANIPHVDIGRALAPDLLHQLYKGMFEHAKDWVEDLLGTDEFNRRFKEMPPAQDLRNFKNGITTVKAWAGRESRDMMRQFLPVVIDTQAPPKFIRMTCELLEFSYLAHGAQITEIKLTEMRRALAAFHEAKKVLVDMDMVVEANSFDRIKDLHMIGHYMQDIRELGAPDGYSTETPEHLHIVYVKIPWRMSN